MQKTKCYLHSPKALQETVCLSHFVIPLQLHWSPDVLPGVHHTPRDDPWGNPGFNSHTCFGGGQLVWKHFYFSASFLATLKLEEVSVFACCWICLIFSFTTASAALQTQTPSWLMHPNGQRHEESSRFPGSTVYLGTVCLGKHV